MKKILFTSLSAAALLIAVSCGNNQAKKEEIVKKEVEVKKVEKVVAEGTSKTVATIGVEGMTCQMGCANAIKSKLGGLAGVLNCDVAFENKKAVVEYDESKLSEKEMIAAIEDLAEGKYSVIEVDIEKTVVDKSHANAKKTSDEPSDAKAKEEVTKQTEVEVSNISFPNIFDLFTRLYQGF